MQNLQQDVLDVNARHNKPILIEIAQQMKSVFSAEDRLAIEAMVI
jgi:hypothetical protein